MTVSLLTYLTVTFFLVITPGATTAVVIQQALRHGHRAGSLAAVGAALGNGLHALLAGLGVAVLLQQWPAAFIALRWAGGLFLCCLAISALRRAWRGPRSVTSGTHASVGAPSSMRQGWLVTLLNPSIVTFYLAVVPGFLTPTAGRAAFASLAAIHIGMAFVCHLCWALAVDRLRRVLPGPSMLRSLDGVAGVALLVVGLRILTAR